MLFLLAQAWASFLADAVAAGDCRTVLAQTDSYAAAEERWRVPRAWCTLKLGDPATAALIVEPPLKAGVLQDYGRLVRARALVQLGALEEARQAVEGLVLPGQAGVELRLLVADVEARRGDVEGTRRVLGSEVGTPRGRSLLGVAHARAGQREQARSIWQALWIEAAPGGVDREARRLLEEHGGFQVDAAGRLSRLRALEKQRRIDEAVALADALRDAGVTIPPVRLARLYLAARRYDDSIRAWTRALGPPTEAAGSPTQLFDAALTHARAGDYDTAAVIYQRLIASHPDHRRADFASFKIGYMEFDRGDCAAALHAFEAHRARYPNSRHLDEALWFSAWCHHATGDVERARSSWATLQRERPRSSLVPGAVYWRARLGGPEEERRGLERVIAGWPVSGYAWFAAQRLGKRFPERPAVDRPPWPERLRVLPAVQRAEALLEVGFRRWARDELRSVEARARSREGKLALGWALMAAGDYRGAQALAKPYCVAPWKGGDPIAQQLCTPRPEAGIVEAVASRYGLDPLVPYGIMTAESALRPEVTSRAGARGLMQLMPEVGARVHRVLYPDRPYDPDDLYAAPYNVSLGTAELGMRARSLAGVLEGSDLPAVIASYNGGEEAVRRWLGRYPEPPPFDRFTEAIGYTETRRYVKRVLGFTMAYRWVYGDPGEKSGPVQDD